MYNDPVIHLKATIDQMQIQLVQFIDKKLAKDAIKAAVERTITAERLESELNIALQGALSRFAKNIAEDAIYGNKSILEYASKHAKYEVDKIMRRLEVEREEREIELAKLRSS